MNNIILDINGVEIKKNDKVKIHCDDGIHEAVVVELFPDCPTVNKEGFWVDVDRGGSSIEGIMSYILEVVNE